MGTILFTRHDSVTHPVAAVSLGGPTSNSKSVNTGKQRAHLSLVHMWTKSPIKLIIHTVTCDSQLRSCRLL